MFRKFIKRNKSDLLFIGLILILSIPLISPYFKTGYFPTHDGEWAVVRLGEMFREIKDFQFPPRYSTVLNNGYGYPLFNFAYPFPYYLAVIVKMTGLGFVASIKTIFAITVPLSGIGMYVLSKKLWGKKEAGIISSLLYMYFPYRMVDLYVRGSIGESVALAIVPFLFVLALQLKDSKKNLLLISISSILLAALILSHNIMAVYFVPLYLLFCIVLITFSKNKFNSNYIAILILGICLSAFFWFPALFEKKNILLSIIPIADRNLYYVSFNKILFPSWGYGVPTDPKDAFSYQLGIGVVLSILFSLVLLALTPLKKKKVNHTFVLAGLLSGVSLIMIFMMFMPSKLVWEHIPILSEINYPWTLLAPIGFIGTLLSGFIVSKSKYWMYLFIGIVLVNGLFVIQYARPEKTSNYEDGYYFTNTANTTSSNEYTPLWVKQLPKQASQQPVEIIHGTGSIDNIIIKSNRITFTARIHKDGLVRINTIYYPGWNIFVNNVSTKFSHNNAYGVMDISLKPGIYTIEARLHETVPRLVSDFVSGVAFIVVFILLVISLIKYITNTKH
jgi:uncharacterized membrane protein